MQFIVIQTSHYHHIIEKNQAKNLQRNKLVTMSHKFHKKKIPESLFAGV